MFEVNGYLWFTEEDFYNDGCDPATAQSHFVKQYLAAETLEGLITKILTEHGQPRQSAMFQSCDEPDRLDINYLTDSEGLPASLTQIDQWKEGRLRLWNAIASYNIEEVNRTPVTLPLR